MHLKNVSRLLQGLAAALIGWSGAAAVIAAFLGTALARTCRLRGGRICFTLQGSRRWVVLWSLFLAPMLIWSLLSAQFYTGLHMLAQAVFGVAAGTAFLGTATQPRVKWWLLAGLTSLLVGASISAYIGPRLLRPYENASIETRLSTRGLTQTITAKEAGAIANRSWLHQGGHGYRLKGYIRAVRRALPPPTSVTITLDWPGRRTKAQTNLIPPDAWASFEVRVDEGDIADPDFLIVRLYSDSPGAIEVAGLQLDSLVGPSPRTPRSTRQELLSGHPVLLAHLAVALAAALLATSGLSAVGLLGVLAAVLVAFAAGSRGALAVVAIWSLLVPLSSTWSRTKKVIAVLIIASVGLGAGLITQETRSGALESAPSRLEIWGLALEAFEAFPALGLEDAGMRTADYFPERTSASVLHAHNFVLQYAASYGVLGALAALLVLVGLLTLAFRYGGARGVVIILPLVALNQIDATLFDARILVAVTLTINALAHAHYRSLGDSTAPLAQSARSI